MNWYKIAQMSALMSLGYKDIFRALKKLGFTLDRTSGSHLIWKNVSTGKSITIAYHQGKRPNYYFLNIDIHKNLGMSTKDFVSLAR